MKKYILLLIGLLFFIPKVYAYEDYDNYFNLVLPSNLDTLINYNYGSNTSIINIDSELSTYHNTYYNYAIFLYLNTSHELSYLYIYLIPNSSLNYYQVYASIGSSYTTIYQTYTMSNSIRIGLQPSDSLTSVIDSSMFVNIKNCMENNVCSETAPSESSYTGSISYNINQNVFSNNRYRITNFDVDTNYDVDNLSILYSSSSSFSLITKSGSGSIYNRVVKMFDEDVSYGSIIDSYVDYIHEPDNPDNPDSPDNPDNPIDTNVGVWKNYVPWFVINDSEYGVLVNIYILFFIIGVGFSVYLFIKLINKSRW